MKYAVLGAGRQGLAIAYDLAVFGEARRVTLVEADKATLRKGVARLRRLAPEVEWRPVQRTLKGKATSLLKGHDAAVSAMPYRFNVALAQSAVEAKVSFCDLGGNTDLVREALKLNRAARAAGIAIVPDCGLAPGLGNVLASIAIPQVKNPKHINIRCGGLPTHPRGPLGYSLLFSIEGLTNEYTGEAVFLRDGKLAKVEAFTECETFRGPAKLGALEAFVTSGGTSLAPWTYRGVLESYEYKTVRYRGHFEKVRAMIELGLLEEGPARDMFHKVVEPRLFDPDVKDLAILRVDCTDARGHGVRYSMLDYRDEETGFTAMERTTGYPTAIVAHAIARRQLKAGAYTPERAGFGPPHISALRRRNIRIRKSLL